MISYFRRVLDTLQRGVQALEGCYRMLSAIHERIHGVGDVQERLDALERSRGVWEGEMEGLLTKVESRFNAVRAAEERVRHAKRRGEDQEGLIPPEVLEELDPRLRALYEGNGEGSDGEGVRPVSEDLEDAGSGEEEADPTAAAMRVKWGG